MNLYRITAPAALLSLDEIKAHLRITSAHDDALLSGLEMAAVAHLDGSAGVLRRALMAQTWEARIDCFPAEMVFLPLPPLQSVESISFLNSDDLDETVADSVYQVVTRGTAGGSVELRPGQSWPDNIKAERDAVRIRFIAGYGTSASDVPQPIRQAALLMIGYLYEQRESVVSAGSVAANPAVNALLDQYRFGRF